MSHKLREIITIRARNFGKTEELTQLARAYLAGRKLLAKNLNTSSNIARDDIEALQTEDLAAHPDTAKHIMLALVDERDMARKERDSLKAVITRYAKSHHQQIEINAELLRKLEDK